MLVFMSVNAINILVTFSSPHLVPCGEQLPVFTLFFLPLKAKFAVVANGKIEEKFRRLFPPANELYMSSKERCTVEHDMTDA